MSDNRAKYESIGILDLKAMAKNRGMKRISKLKKKELIDAMLAQDELDAMEASGEDKQSVVPETRQTEPVEEKQDEASYERQADLADERREPYARRPIRGRRPMEGDQPRRRRPVGYQEDRPARRSYQTGEERPYRRGNSEDLAEVAEDNSVTSAYQASSMPQYDDAKECGGILEVMQDGFGFIRSDNYLPGENDVYVSHSQIRRFNLKTGDIISGMTRKNNVTDKFGALLYIKEVNGLNPEQAAHRPNFEDLTPIFPEQRIRLEREGCTVAMRIVDMISPIGKGQRGMIVAQPKAGKTTLLKQVATSVKESHPEMHLIILLIDERPEEVTDMKETVEGDGCEVIYSTFDETPEHHKRVSEMVIERAKRLVEQGQDVMILLDSITRLARAYNLTVSPSGRTLSGGLDPAALHMPKRFFGAARNMREGGSLTILATALVETGSKMDDVVFEEFKGTGNMELVLDRKISEKRIFPAIDLARSSTRREDLLLTREEITAADIIRKGLNGLKKDDAAQTINQMFTHTLSNQEFVREVIRKRVL
ncbi:MAG: transcription termination factor Rho [Lachnospiraceae bacterium]|nr:transcription termination factor Rho [Lachnospiraceae bacterium]